MERFFILDKFNTWYDWDLILTSKEITPPEVKSNLIDLDGMSGSLDLTEALSGEPTFTDRVISATFWTDKGTRDERSRLLRDIRIALHGRKIKIIEPDDPDHYFIGRVQITGENNIIPYAELSIEIICDPWRYANNESERFVELNGDTQDVVIYNGGFRTLSPTLEASDTAVIIIDGSNVVLKQGTYMLTDLKLYHGFNVISVTGSGDLTIKYREADL